MPSPRSSLTSSADSANDELPWVLLEQNLRGWLRAIQAAMAVGNAQKVLIGTPHRTH
jgi:hypothetical protein